MNNAARLLIADSHRVFSGSLRQLLGKFPEFRLIGVVDRAETVLDVCRTDAPEIVILGVSRHNSDGVQLVGDMKKIAADVKIVVLTDEADKGVLEQLCAAGVSGLLLKQCTVVELVDAVRAVRENRFYLGARLQEVLDGRPPAVEGNLELGNADDLSPREQEVLRLIAAGLRNKDIAAELGVGVKAVDGLRTRLMQKLKIHHVAGLTKYAIRHGLTTLDH